MTPPFGRRGVNDKPEERDCFYQTTGCFMQAMHNKSLGELFADLTRDVSNLMRQEVQLARTEISQNVVRAAKNAGLLIGAGMAAFFAAQALIACGILALAQIVAPWLAALVVALALLIVAGVLATMGIEALRKSSLTPKQTVETIREDVRWAKQQIHTP
jgi:hypothetical protein